METRGSKSGLKLDRGNGVPGRAMRTFRILRTLLVISVVASTLGAFAQSSAPKSQLQFSSSDQQLVNAFDWAKRQALAYAFKGDPVGLWYEAALPGRDAFCMRDVSHQSVGAQALGLSAYTYNMLHHFAAGISASKDWCGYWEINRENRPAPIDYESDAAFWYDLPANFDVLDTSYRMYLWTGDIRYIDNPVFDNFYDRTMHAYVRRWSLAPDTIMTRHRWLLPMTEEETREKDGVSRFRRGIPGYNESERNYVAGIGLLSVEYAAERDYAAIERMRGNDLEAKEAADRAAAIQSLVNTKWWNATDDSFYSTLDAQHQLKGRDALDVLYWGVAEAGPKTKSAVNDLLAETRRHPPCAVEEASHYAEVFYHYGKTSAGYSMILNLASPGHCRQEYPEVSFSEVGAITIGVMGVSIVPSPERVVETLPGLTSETAWAEMKDIPLGRNLIAIRHDGDRKSVFSNTSGPALLWRAAFPGRHQDLLVEGRPMKANIQRHFGREISWVQVPVGAGDTTSVSVP